MARNNTDKFSTGPVGAEYMQALVEVLISKDWELTNVVSVEHLHFSFSYSFFDKI